MGLFARLFGRETGKVDVGDDGGFRKTLELAGFFAAHAVWCVSDGETLVPLIGQETAKGRNLIRLDAERLEEAVKQGAMRLDANPERARRAVFIYDGFLTDERGRSDALIVKAVAYDDGGHTLNGALRYRPATAEGGFAVLPPKLAVTPDMDPATAVADFFRGVGAHEKGAAVWKKYLDESR